MRQNVFECEKFLITSYQTVTGNKTGNKLFFLVFFILPVTIFFRLTLVLCLPQAEDVSLSELSRKQDETKQSRDATR